MKRGDPRRLLRAFVPSFVVLWGLHHMDRLDFEMPEFVRLSWVSDLAREVWEPRLTRIMKAWSEIEWLSIVAGVRPCGVTTAAPEDYLSQAGEWIKRDLYALPIEMQSLANYVDSSDGPTARPGTPFLFRFVLGSARDVSDFKDAWDAGEAGTIERLLGTPPCCFEALRKAWVEEGLTDSTWPMAVATSSADERATTIEVNGPPESNILWRWMGVRAVPHVPCRFDCRASVELGEKCVAVGRDAGFGTEMDWLLDILSWPVEYTALHGIAEIKTPVVKVSTKTDATPRKYTVRRIGDAYPAEGVRGLVFPYRQPGRAMLTSSRAFQRGLMNPIPILELPVIQEAIPDGAPGEP